MAYLMIGQTRFLLLISQNTGRECGPIVASPAHQHNPVHQAHEFSTAVIVTVAATQKVAKFLLNVWRTPHPNLGTIVSVLKSIFVLLGRTVHLPSADLSTEDVWYSYVDFTSDGLNSTLGPLI